MDAAGTWERSTTISWTRVTWPGAIISLERHRRCSGAPAGMMRSLERTSSMTTTTTTCDASHDWRKLHDDGASFDSLAHYQPVPTPIIGPAGYTAPIVLETHCWRRLDKRRSLRSHCRCCLASPAGIPLAKSPLSTSDRQHDTNATAAAAANDDDDNNSNDVDFDTSYAS